ncbi:hypothetical protein GRI89_11715 [Altererythrobacter salegens]|uniref:SH3 domain-containing protein n=1 Tax=Croceibacterium salegens TaxID=1737568 RepID=A0A6I4SZI0_9SPHN|nr:hypothetical protein [Croceibacterium salegens]MXO60206.1 hypothetical protein [Croceibacterium salegens]
MKALVAALPLVLLLAGCQREDAPADNLVESAGQLVGAEQPVDEKLAEGRYAPRDTCSDLKGADTFRQDLAVAVQARDADGLAALAAEDVKLDFGGGTGREELRKRLTGKEWNLWDELDELLTLGCSANAQGGLTIPWYFDQPIDGVDPYSGMLVTGEKVPLRESPQADSAVLEEISWDVVTIDALRPDDRYQQVTSRDGKSGFILTDKLRSLVDYRLSAASRNGSWRIVSLVAGD